MEDIYKDHKLIAEFMGFKYYPFNNESGKDPGWKTHPDAKQWSKTNNAHNLFANGVSWKLPDGKIIDTKGNGEIWKYLCRSHKDLKYDTDWNWLMEVVTKIEKMGYGFTVDPWGIEIIDYTTGNEEIIVNFDNDDDYPKIKQYFMSIIDFIKWFNENKTK